MLRLSSHDYRGHRVADLACYVPLEPAERFDLGLAFREAHVVAGPWVEATRTPDGRQWSQRVQAGVGVRQLARVEAGKGSPSVLWLLDLAAALGVPPSLLVDGAVGS